jgi:hypothetical protein
MFAVAPCRDLLPYTASFFSTFIAIREEVAEPVDTARKGLITVAESQTHATAPAAIRLAVESSDPAFRSYGGNQRDDAAPFPRFEMECAFRRGIRPRESHSMGLHSDGIYQLAFHKCVNSSRRCSAQP